MKTKEFFRELGYTFNIQFITDENATCIWMDPKIIQKVDT